MYRPTAPARDSTVRYMTRKRRNSDSTPPITNFFATVKRERSNSESKDVSQKLEDSLNTSIDHSHKGFTENGPLYSLEELRNLLGVPTKPPFLSISNQDAPIGLENLPAKVYSYIFTILDMQSVSALSLASTTMSTHVKGYVSTHDFYRRMQLDNLDFLNSSFRPEDDEYVENDPFVACGTLIKSITITLDTKIRAEVFLNICRNLRNQLGGSLHGFGRCLETMTENWKFSERRIMVKAAVLIDPDLRRSIIKVLTGQPGQFISLEMKVRSGLTQLFLNKNQEVDESTPQEVIEFGAWLSVVLRNVIDKYQGKLYFILFGPTKSSRVGERVDWDYFCDNDSSKFTLRKSEPNYKKILSSLLNGIRALRIMNNSKATDMAWNGKKIYTLFLRVIEVCETRGDWSELASSTALAIDCSGLLSEYLVTCLDPTHNDYPKLLKEAAEMICLVRTHLYRWSANPATFLAEPLHHAFNHLAQLDGRYDGCYKSFLDEIWTTQKLRLKVLVRSAKGNTASGDKIREELDGQLSMVRLLSEFSNTVSLNQQALQQNVVQEHNNVELRNEIVEEQAEENEEFNGAEEE
ncbi:unnamed protein product [Caenorhabditis brenneri]